MDVYIAVMDYANCVIRKYTAYIETSDGIPQIEDVENWLYNNANYDVDTCDFMFTFSEIEVINC